MLKYDYFSVMQKLSVNSCEAVGYACKRRAQSPHKIAHVRAESYKALCELERALFSDFLPPLDRATLAAYAHSLCAIIDAALLYSRTSQAQHSPLSAKGFEWTCISLCEILAESAAMLERIKKSSDIPRLEEFREKKSQALECICEGSGAPQIFATRQDLLFAISGAFDMLVELILKSI